MCVWVLVSLVLPCAGLYVPVHGMLHQMNRLYCAAKRILRSLPHGNSTITAVTSASAPAAMLQLNLGHMLGPHHAAIVCSKGIPTFRIILYRITILYTKVHISHWLFSYCTFIVVKQEEYMHFLIYYVYSNKQY